jgi:hypothetical protein
MAKEQILRFKPTRRLEEVLTNIASECRSGRRQGATSSANIVRDHAVILPDDATPKPQMPTSAQMLFTMAIFGHVLIAGITLLIAVALNDSM